MSTETVTETNSAELEGFPLLLLQRLVADAHLDQGGAARAERAFAQTGTSMVEILVHLGLCSERDLAIMISAITGLEVVGSDIFPAEALFRDKLSPRFLRNAKVCPIAETNSGVIVAAIDPANNFATHALELSLGAPVSLVIATASMIDEAIHRLYGGTELTEAGDNEHPKDHGDADLGRLRDAAQEAPVIRFVERLIAHAIEAGASDIHIEPLEHRLRIRIRVDGVLRDEEPAPATAAPAIISRIKILARLDIAERRLPQDGSIKMNVRGREVDLRVATSPIAHGEAAVIRILDRGAVELELEKLGFDSQVFARLLQILKRPNGIFLVTGPTGSGKSTTLYAALNGLNVSERKIVTIEDPIEYKIEGLNQIQVRPEIGLDFEQILRSTLRHDPDIIMVGEIRDRETARIAVQAALTGHLVLSTLHTNDAASAVTRLLDMGIEDYLVASTISGVLAQRLVRVACKHCRTSDATAIGACPACGGSGYQGRTTIAELLTFDSALRKAILDHQDAAHLRALAIEAGMETLFENGMTRVRAGITTYDEIIRVAADSE